MPTDLTQLIQAAQKLSPTQKLALISAIASDIPDINTDPQQFWNSEPLEETLKTIEPIRSIEELRSQAWPEDEPIENFLEYLKTERQTALEQEAP